jgi:uncharacterized protein with HEPN domain
MLRSEDRNLLSLLVMLESVSKIEIYGSGFDDAVDFFQHDDQAKFNASLLLLLNIGEQIGKLSDEIRLRNGSFPFNEIRGLRNRIAHDYTGIDYEMVFNIVKKDILDIKPLLTSLIHNELLTGKFDVEEIRAAAQSPFYKHVDFNKLLPKE